MSSLGCLVSMVRMKIYFRKIAEQTAVGLISTSADGKSNDRVLIPVKDIAKDCELVNLCKSVL